MGIKPMELNPVANRKRVSKILRNLRYGKVPLLVGKDPITGHLYLPATKRRVSMRVNAILDIADIIKIGVSGDTDVRTDYGDYRRTWKYISRVYKTTSKKNAKNFEVELIKKFKKSHPDQVANISVSKAPRLTTYDGFYYIYVVFNVNMKRL
jgi:hypothetical protein